jgi:hypothetical protein
MFTDDPKPVVEIEQKIRAILFPPGATAPAYDFGHIMLALMNCIIWEVSFVCPVCRKNIMRQIKRELPSMEKYAAELYTISRAGKPPIKCCH